MAYVRAKKILSITWDDGSELAGLTVKVKRSSIDVLLRAEELMAQVKKDGDDKAVKELFELFASVLVSWDLEEREEEDGPSTPVPATLEGLYSQDLAFALMLIVRWYEVASGVSDDLGKESTSGVQFPEASIPMDVSSIDLESLVAQS